MRSISGASASSPLIDSITRRRLSARRVVSSSCCRSVSACSVECVFGITLASLSVSVRAIVTQIGDTATRDALSMDKRRTTKDASAILRRSSFIH